MNSESDINAHGKDADDESPFLGLAGDFPLFDGLLSDRGSQLAAFRRRRSAFNEKSIHPVDLDLMLAKGWEVFRTGKRLTRIRQAKPHHQMLEDRAWSILYLMDYDELSENAFAIKFQRSIGSLGTKQIDAFACDTETAIIIECKSRVTAQLACS